jgi:hypothetical protein
METRALGTIYRLTEASGVTRLLSPQQLTMDDVFQAEHLDRYQHGRVETNDRTGESLITGVNAEGERVVLSREEESHHPLSYSGEERHEVREQTETTLRQSFEDRAQALIDRIQAIGQTREQGQEIG